MRHKGSLWSIVYGTTTTTTTTTTVPTEVGTQVRTPTFFFLFLCDDDHITWWFRDMGYHILLTTTPTREKRGSEITCMSQSVTGDSFEHVKTALLRQIHISHPKRPNVWSQVVINTLDREIIWSASIMHSRTKTTGEDRITVTSMNIVSRTTFYYIGYIIII